MRVTMLSKALVMGAYQRKCELIAAHPDIELTVLVPPAWGGQPLQRAHTAGYALREIPIRFGHSFHLHYYPTLKNELERAKPDVFHIDEEPYNLATWLAVQDAMTLRATHLKGASHVTTLFFSWQNILRRYPPPFSWMERAVLRQADAAIVGNGEAEQVWRAKGFSKPIHIIPQFGVDECAFSSNRKSKIENRKFTIGYFGRLVKEKGVAHVIEVLPDLPEARLLVVGEGPLRQVLQQFAESLEVSHRVEFRPQAPSTQMPALFGELDALVLPSLTQRNWKEQFGRVLIEAMACGVPVVGSSCGEIPKVIGDAGLVFPEGDGEALLQHLQQLHQHPALRDVLAQRGRERVLQHFTMQHVANATVEVYRQLANSQ
jgi:glycosyltransferase involved in cell wall biosynthesis